ncbi:hypothetical protein Ate01nite_41760 [Actinoplanes teichomyceticus]|nr:hypothetical protein Ate01nite_41760 [Actinoplanes teichomyceticus]
MTEQAAAVAAGTVKHDEATAALLWPAGFTDAVDAVLDAYEREIAGLPTPGDGELWAAVERVVTALNEVDGGHIETGEREELAEYIDAVLTGAGVDVAALTSRRGLHRSELTDTWREW